MSEDEKFNKYLEDLSVSDLLALLQFIDIKRNRHSNPEWIKGKIDKRHSLVTDELNKRAFGEDFNVEAN